MRPHEASAHYRRCAGAGEPPMLRLYDNHLSGNGYKPRLLIDRPSRANL